MIPFERAFGIALGAARRVGTERVALDRAPGRILAEDVVSDAAVPPFDKSAMDGYACRREDLAGELEVVETIPAGHVPQKRVGKGQCAGIMTGAMVPEGADCVIKVEDTRSPTDGAVRFVGKSPGDNICLKGEDVRQGDVVLEAGARIGPAQVAVLAGLGRVRPLVSQLPRVAVMATGDELVEPDGMPSPSQIRNTNGPQLLAQAARMGVPARYLGIAKDSPAAIGAALKEAARASDVVILSGGVSVGEFDLVPRVLRAGGFDLLFEKIATKPGKPTVFGVSAGAVAFGLPGNPAATFVLFETLVKPFLYKMMGHEFRPPNVVMPLEETVSRKKTERMSWIPVALTDSGGVRPVEYHGSAHVHSLCFADGLISVPVGVAQLAKGTLVHVRQV